jgi:hypothetical protein
VSAAAAAGSWTGPRRLQPLLFVFDQRNVL